MRFVVKGKIQYILGMIFVLFADFTILIDDNFEVTAFKGSKPVNITEMIDSLTCKLTLYSPT